MGFLHFIIFSSLLLLHSIHAQHECSSRFCGNNPNGIRFPYKLQGQQPQHCGYPGFDVRCTKQKSKQKSKDVVVLNLPYSGDFLVRDINYLVQEILLYDANGCLPRRLLSLNLSSSPFVIGYSKKFTFLRCPPDVVKTRFTIIDCLSNSTSSVIATSSMNLVNYLNMCSTIVADLPVSVSWPLDNRDDDWLSSNLNGDLRLTWEDPDCQGCVARGGICGYQNRTSDLISCFSDPKIGSSRGLRIFKILALSIVIPSIICAFFISCFLCMTERRAAHNSAAVAPPPPSPPPNVVVGLDESTIESYTKVVLGESKRLPGPNGATCPICLGDYHPKDTVRSIPECEHCFHSDCVDEWLRLNGTCPVCRNTPSRSVT
ncbi:hypothetical protein ACS0TY_019186 [Phlomoides rotata]